ncbi:7,8-dihydro-8-oxoguanine-triphosphatase [Shewanella colwelliana]|uniref:8-oxo-dGTP diphosphatase n=1 Tax=Shewanella colwelliana TaxID=23 RepID=A0ABQ4PG74_SHECO|nr:8-oxo-dGTP diphosphatase MutT [Shewanella colwelliana]GIU46438.1 7,8-dihydro-8-oxoguanine-triphosphatase [Shewanella colwelliana]
MKRVHVAVGVILNASNQVLLAKRPDNLHQGGKWEFPGGKVEQDETTSQALIRELREEVNLIVSDTTPLMTISHDYPDKEVLLDIHTVNCFSGDAEGLEGQEILWVELSNLKEYNFPAANTPIIDRLLSL